MNDERTTQVTFRDLQPTDLDDLAWAGGDAHLAAVRDALEASWRGEVEIIVGELCNQRLIAHGALDLRSSEPKVWMLVVHPAWQSLGVGTALLAHLEERASTHGADSVWLTVETDNPRAKALYLRQGYREDGSLIETWPIDGGCTYACVTDKLTKSLR